MIKTKSELYYDIAEDAKANGVSAGLKYFIALLYGNVNTCVFRYLKSLCKYELLS